MTLNLISPIGSNFIKDFPGQNAVNMDAIDAAAGPCLQSDALFTSTPTFLADTTNPTLGTAGYTKGWYYLIFDQVYFFGEVRFGTAGINIGLGLYSVTLPFLANSLLPYSNTPGKSSIVGTAQTFDASANAGRLPLTVHLRNSNEIFFGIKMNSGSSFRELREAGSGITWAINDGISWSCRYQRALTI